MAAFIWCLAFARTHISHHSPSPNRAARSKKSINRRRWHLNRPCQSSRSFPRSTMPPRSSICFLVGNCRGAFVTISRKRRTFPRRYRAALGVARRSICELRQETARAVGFAIQGERRKCRAEHRREGRQSPKVSAGCSNRRRFLAGVRSSRRTTRPPRQRYGRATKGVCTEKIGGGGEMMPDLRRIYLRDRRPEFKRLAISGTFPPRPLTSEELMQGIYLHSASTHNKGVLAQSLSPNRRTMR